MGKEPHIVAINIGNTRTQAAVFDGAEPTGRETVTNDQIASLVPHLLQWWKQIAEKPAAAIVVASVNDPVADQLVPMIEGQLSTQVFRVGDDLPAPIGTALEPETITGVDRLLNAAAAFDRLKQACIVIDAGTAVTIDFVDGEGTFHGGAIAPGVRLQLDAMHRHASALPELEFTRPDDEAFGRSTGQAMLQGVFHGLRGLAWKLVERYAEHYGAFPTVIATGGDAEALFADDELVDRIVPDLTLLGIAAAARHALAANPDDE